MQARNDDELLAMVMPGLKKAVDYVVNEIMRENEQYVKEIVYEAYEPVIYERSGEFNKAWTTEKAKINGSNVKGEFRYAPEKLTTGGNGVHTSLNPNNQTDVRPYLAEIIYEGLAGAIYQKGHASETSWFHGQAWTKKRNAWEKLKKKIGKERFRKYFEFGMAQAGIRFKRGRGALKVYDDEK